MRKTLTQALLAAFCAILAAGWMARGTFAADMGGGSMIAAAHHSMLQKAAGWVNPYVTDGLVDMWDGEWNAGPGVHDATKTDEAVNLVNGGSALVYKDAEITISSKSICFNPTTYTGPRAQASQSIYLTQDMSIRSVFRLGNNALWAVREWYGLLYIPKTGVFTLARGINNQGLPAIKYTADYADSTDRLFELSSIGLKAGDIATVDVVFHRDNKSFDGYCNGQLVWSLASQADNWLGDNTPLATTVLYSQSSAQQTNTVEMFNGGRYSRALTAAEIAANFQVDKDRFGLT